MKAAQWEQPGAETVAPGVHRIPLPLPGDGLRAVNAYAIETGGGLVLIDSGWALAEAREQLEQSVKTLGYGLADVQRFLITHVHRDHYTQAVALRREFGARIGLGEGERPSLRIAADGGTSVFETQVRMLRRAGADGLARAVAEFGSGDEPDLWLYADPDEWISGEPAIPVGERTLQVVATPGHTRGHLVFRDASGSLLFAGDHVLPHITPSVGFEPAAGRLSLAAYLSSLASVRALPDTRLLPAHGPVTGSVHARVDELLAHHADRLARTAGAVAAGAATGFAVARALTWTRRKREFGSLDVFNQMLAVNETVAHLEVLAARHQLHVSDDGAVQHYRTLGCGGDAGPAELASD
ncbi:MAG: MBL fold metallo-hydrolase [Micromonosporaceae bacterium]